MPEVSTAFITDFITKYSPQWAQSLSIMGMGIVGGIIFALGIGASYILLKRMLKSDIEDNESIRSELSTNLEEQSRIANEVKLNTESIHNLKALEIPSITPLVKDIESIKNRKPQSLDHLATNVQLDKIIEQFNGNLELLSENIAALNDKLDKTVADVDAKLKQIQKLIGELGE